MNKLLNIPIKLKPTQVCFVLQLHLPHLDLINYIEFNFDSKLELNLRPSNNHQDLKQIIDNYFSGKCAQLALAHMLNAKSPFQLQVLQALQKISYGTQKTYGELAS